LSSQREQEGRAETLLDACVRAAGVGAAYIRSRTGDLHAIDWQVKSRADFVSEVDTGAEERISESLLRAVPGSRVLGEELSPGASLGSGVIFIVDPLDGTTNFLHGYPQYAVSIGALVDGETLAGTVLQVPQDSLFTATRGGGAWRDGQRIRVSTNDDPLRALIGTGFPFKALHNLPEYLSQLARITAATAGVRRAGSAALDLADVACGRFEAFWELTLAPWDIAAGILMIREAGGRVTDLEGNDVEPSHTPVVASNGLMHEWMLEQVGNREPGTGNRGPEGREWEMGNGEWDSG
jgi:myo-inositol-1(or 4)-monophosphatase